MTVRQEVIRFRKMYNIAVNGKDGIPLLSKGEALECLDNWEAAKAFLLAQRSEHQIGNRSVWFS